MGTSHKNLELSLLILRIGVTIVMAVWVLDKFFNPGHAAAVFGGFYGLSGIAENLFVFVGIAQAVIVVCFFVGIAKFWSRLAVLLMAAAGTLTPFAKYLDPFSGPNILFFAAWPMFAAAIVLFLMRDSDTLVSRV
ncbi:MAG: hypothetical protein AAF402_13700 [Pseudomonadota bacterium]